MDISQTLHSLPIRNRIVIKSWLFYLDFPSIILYHCGITQPILVFISGNLLQFESSLDNKVREYNDLKQKIAQIASL